MDKKYNISSSSDMRRLKKDLEKSIMDQATSAILKQQYNVECPHCHSQVKVSAGISTCPMCGDQIDLQVNIT
ncbi:MAG: hypothetical protein RR343_02790 [Oscillospiraceae bacterium]